MKIIPAKTPGFVQSLFPNFIWSINTKSKVLYLTFDDGPTPNITDWVLDTLNAYNAKATFFCIGNNIEAHSEIFQRILENGHRIGNHTYNHLKGWETKTKQYLGDVELTDSVIQFQLHNYNNATSTDLIDSKLFRPPYGKFKKKQSKKLMKEGYKIVLWDVLSYDWDNSVSEDHCLKNVISSAKEGSIVVFHDSEKASKNLKYVLPKILEYYKEKGFVFEAITKRTLE